MTNPSKPEAEPPSQEATIYAMVHVAETLKDAYARLFETKGQGVLRPESSLPASKEKLKAALLLVAMYHKLKKRLDRAEFDRFQVCYGLLADFVSDDMAEKSRKFLELARDPDAARGQEDPKWLAGQILKTSIPIEEMGSSNQEFSRLCEEFEHRLSTLDDPARKAQEFAVIRDALLGVGSEHSPLGGEGARRLGSIEPSEKALAAQLEKRAQAEVKSWHRRVTGSLAVGIGLFALAVYGGAVEGVNILYGLGVLGLLCAAFCAGNEDAWKSIADTMRQTAPNSWRPSPPA